jgi:histidinol-phosphatase
VVDARRRQGRAADVPDLTRLARSGADGTVGAVSADLDLALQLADAADEISLPRFRSGIAFETKADLTPVTAADRAVETRLRELLAQARPGDAVLGEEHGVSGEGGRRWILDPIDGTRNYARGVPVWATLVALEEDGTVQLGVASAPALGRRWWAERGAGAFADGDRIGVSSVERVEDAVLSFAYENDVPEIARRAWHVRGLGDFWAHMLVAEGAVDGAVDAIGIKEWDLAAAQVIVEEAGGRFSDFAGESRIDNREAISSNGLLHDEILGAVAGHARVGATRRSASV